MKSLQLKKRGLVAAFGATVGTVAWTGFYAYMTDGDVPSARSLFFVAAGCGSVGFAKAREIWNECLDNDFDHD